MAIVRRNIIAIVALCANFTFGHLNGQKSDNIPAKTSNNINCVNQAVTLKLESKRSGYAYKWSGPHGYKSTSKSPITNIPGTYTAQLTNLKTGQTSKETIVVSVDTISPKEVTAIVSGVLDCNRTLVTLSGNSKTAKVLYEWKGPKGFKSAQKEDEIGVPGNYVLTVTNPLNGCETKKVLTVVQNIKAPEDVNATVSGVITCNAKEVELIGSSSTKGVEYKWTGKDFVQSSRETKAAQSGKYKLVVTNPDNNCTSETEVIVTASIKPPSLSGFKAKDTITCKKDKTKLLVTSVTKGAVFEWSGPKGFSFSGKSFETSIPGNYILTALNPANGCSISKSAEVLKDISTPKDLKINSPKEISCIDTVITLTPVSTNKNLIYQWSGPNGFSSSDKIINVDKTGIYQVQASKMSNGCSNSESVKVTSNVSYPQDVSAKSSGSISCESKKVKLSGKSSTEKVHFDWKGPKGFISKLDEAIVELPGEYFLSVTHPVSGCKVETQVTVNGKVCNE